MRFSQVIATIRLVLWIGLIFANKVAHAQVDEIPISPDEKIASQPSVRRLEFSHSLGDSIAIPSSVTSSSLPHATPNTQVPCERRIELSVVLPSQTTAAPTLLFLPELGSNSQACDYLMEHWAHQGLACIFLSHGDGIDTLLEQTPLVSRISTFQSLGNSDTLRNRSHDASQAISILRQWSESPTHPLSGQLDWDRFGMVGHGFGASVTLQFLTHAMRTKPSPDSAETTSHFQAPLQPKAVCLLGPTPLSEVEQNQLATLPCLPGLIISGDLDESLIRRPDPLRRNHWFDRYPNGADRFELRILDGRHFDFTNTPLRFGRPSRNPNYHPLLQSITTSFFQAYLASNPDAHEVLVNPDINPAIQKTVRWSSTLAKP